MKSYNQFTAEAYSNKENIQEAIPLALMGAAKLASMGLSAYSAYSAAQNLRKGKYGDAALDALGMVPGSVAFKGAKALGAGRNLARGASATQSVVRNFSPNARNRAIEGGIDMATKAVLGTGAATASEKDSSKTQPAAPASSSTPPTPKSSSVVLARKGGVMGKLDKSTGKWTKGDWTDKESARYKKVATAMGKNPTPAAPATTSPAAPAPKMTGSITPVKNSPPSKVGSRSAEQKNADNLRLGAELGGVAKLAAQQKYSNQNSLVAQGRKAAANREPLWKQASKGFKNRDYGIPDFVSDRRRENQGAMVDANVDAGMNRADAEAKATRDEKELHRKNMGYMKNRKTGNYKDVGY